MGDWLYNATLLAYVYMTTDSATWVGAATIFRLLPDLLLGTLGGVIADRYDKRIVLLTGDVLRAGLMFQLAPMVALEAPIVVAIALATPASAAASAERPAAVASPAVPFSARRMFCQTWSARAGWDGRELTVVIVR